MSIEDLRAIILLIAALTCVINGIVLYRLATRK